MDSAGQDVWRDYARRKREERLAEAGQVWQALVAAGGGAETVLAIDFVCFGSEHADVEGLRRHLAENCTVTTAPGPAGYRLLQGTTRPYGVTFSETEHLDWVTFMCDVAQDHGCVFSTWTLSDPSSSLTVSSEAVADTG